MCNMEGDGGGGEWGVGDLIEELKELILSGNSKYIFKLI